eukprot:8410954-Pyramimonas_sp.AAC.1
MESFMQQMLTRQQNMENFMQQFISHQMGGGVVPSPPPPMPQAAPATSPFMSPGAPAGTGPH